MAHICIRELEGNNFLRDFTQREQEQLLYYLLNKDFFTLSSGPSRHINPVTGRRMNSTSFCASDDSCYWCDEDFYAIRENRQSVPVALFANAITFFKNGCCAHVEDDCWKYGLRLHKCEFSQTEEGMREFNEQLADMDDFCLNHTEYCPYPKTMSDSDSAIAD